jgi:hypothetical protein
MQCAPFPAGRPHLFQSATGKLNKLALGARYQDHLIESAKTQTQAR